MHIKVEMHEDGGLVLTGGLDNGELAGSRGVCRQLGNCVPYKNTSLQPHYIHNSCSYLASHHSCNHLQHVLLSVRTQELGHVVSFGCLQPETMPA